MTKNDTPYKHLQARENKIQKKMASGLANKIKPLNLRLTCHHFAKNVPQKTLAIRWQFFRTAEPACWTHA
jgi:hypothetical protein